MDTPRTASTSDADRRHREAAGLPARDCPPWQERPTPHPADAPVRR